MWSSYEVKRSASVPGGDFLGTQLINHGLQKEEKSL